MVQFLILRDASIGTGTSGENQTPLHYAAKNDATHSLKTLLKYGADIDDRDYKERTPLQVNKKSWKTRYFYKFSWFKFKFYSTNCAFNQTCLAELIHFLYESYQSYAFLISPW